MRASTWAWSAVLACGCDVVSGLSDFELGTGSGQGGAGGSGASGGSGGAGGSPGGGAPCVEGPIDAFEGNMLDAGAWTEGGSGLNATLQLVAGEARFDAGNDAAERYRWVTSNGLVPFLSCGVQAELTHSDAKQGSVVYFAVEIGGAEYSWIRFEQVDDRLAVRYRFGDSWTDIAEMVFDSDAHRHWRIEEAGGAVRWLVSPDGVAWTLLATAVPSFPLGPAQIAFGAGATTPGTFLATFGGINTPH